MTEIYDVIIIGGGSAGLTAATLGGGMGRKVAVIERERLGGECTWTGCIPSKELMKVAKIAHSIRTAHQFGIQVCDPVIDMAAVRKHIAGIVQEIYRPKTPDALQRSGIEIVQGEARFLDTRMILVGSRQMRARKFIIATGGRAAVPPIPGLSEAPYKTYANFFENDRLPKHLLVMGTCPIGIEMAQAYVRLGAQVTLVGDQVMPREEPEAVAVLRRVLVGEGVNIQETSVTEVHRIDNEIALYLKNGQEVRGDMLLVAGERVPNIEMLDLDKAGVEYSPAGIRVNDHLQTNIPHIYAVGDITTGPKSAHYAGFQGDVALHNALLPFAKGKGLEVAVPWVMYTDPEVAQVGLTEARARQKFGDAVKTYTLTIIEGDRAIADGETAGFVKLVYRGASELLGATVVVARAGEVITEFTLVIEKKVSLRSLVGTIHPYPTYSEFSQRAIRRLVFQELLNAISRKIVEKAAGLLP